jgi:IS5 family transposase
MHSQNIASDVSFNRSDWKWQQKNLINTVEELVRFFPGLSSGLVHSVVGTAANVANVTRVDQLLHGEESYVSGDAGYTGVEKRPEHQDRQMIWSIAARPSSYKKHAKKSLIGRMRRKIEYAKAQSRAKVEHPFRVIKRQFGYTNVCFRGLLKNTAQQATLFALSNLWTMRKRLLNTE